MSSARDDALWSIGSCDHALETCKRALHKVDNLIARAEKAEKDRDAAEVERDDAIRTAQDNAEQVEKLKELLLYAEAALADIGDADREPGDDMEWCENRAAEALLRIRAALTDLAAEPMKPLERRKRQSSLRQTMDHRSESAK